jgi:hypothetical protein
MAEDFRELEEQAASHVTELTPGTCPEDQPAEARKRQAAG